jgi:hypothetical protein
MSGRHATQARSELSSGRTLEMDLSLATFFDDLAKYLNGTSMLTCGSIQTIA